MGLRTLVVTNDFPPRRGGIEAFVFSLCARLPAGELAVYAASMPGAAELDAQLAYPVIRDPAGTLLPTPQVAKRVQAVARDLGAEAVVFGAAAPLGLLARGLREHAGVRRIVGLTHGHEVWWSRVPAARAALRRIGAETDVLTYVSDYCRREIATALTPAAAARMVRLAPGVDTEVFRPGCGGAEVRRRLGIPATAPVVVCTARMVARKGQDTLVRAWPRILARVPDARLLLVGDGPALRPVERLAHAGWAPPPSSGGAHAGARGRSGRSGWSGRGAPQTASIVFAGAAPWGQMPAYTDAGDVFAMPCRTRLGGLEPEALGIVSLEAAACGLPIVVGDSGGAREAVRDGDTGYVVGPLDVRRLADTIAGLLSDPARARAMGERGRQWAAAEWSWDRPAAALRSLLAG